MKTTLLLVVTFFSSVVFAAPLHRTLWSCEGYCLDLDTDEILGQLPSGDFIVNSTISRNLAQHRAWKAFQARCQAWTSNGNSSVVRIEEIHLGKKQSSEYTSGVTSGSGDSSGYSDGVLTAGRRYATYSADYGSSQSSYDTFSSETHRNEESRDVIAVPLDKRACQPIKVDRFYAPEYRGPRRGLN